MARSPNFSGGMDMSEQMAEASSMVDSTTWQIEMKQPDESWRACTSPRRDPADLMSVWDFRAHAYPDDEHRIVRVDVHVSLTSPEEVRDLIPQQPAQEKEKALQSD